MTNADVLMDGMLDGMEDIIQLEGTYSFNVDQTVQIIVYTAIDTKGFLAANGLKGFGVSSEELIVTVVVNAGYTIDADLVLTLNDMVVEPSVTPNEFCITFLGQSECMNEEEMLQEFGFYELDLEQRLNRNSLKQSGDVLFLWNDNCEGPSAGCALILIRNVSD